MFKIILIFCLTISSILPVTNTVFADHEPNGQNHDSKTEIDTRFSSFQTFQKVEIPKDTNLNRVAIPYTNNQNGFSILETSSNRIQPYITRSIYEPNSPKTFILENSPVRTTQLNLVDKDFSTSTTFNFEESNGYSYVILKLEKPIKTRTISLYLDSNSPLPDEVGLSFVNVEKQYQSIINKTWLTNPILSFPEVESDTFKLEFYHKQPLRIQELEIGNSSPKLLSSQLIWLGRPGETYQVFQNSDVPVASPNTNEGDLGTIDDIVRIVDGGETQKNIEYKEQDTDKDGIINTKDNCPSVANQDQKDGDTNGKGDVCEDKDGDSVLDGLDNCKEYPNRSQLDTDNNKIGDICEDIDNDSIPNEKDNCPRESNLLQTDTDQDKKGDECDNEESRFFERNSVINWLVLAAAAIILCIVFVITMKKNKKV